MVNPYQMQNNTFLMKKRNFLVIFFQKKQIMLIF